VHSYSKDGAMRTIPVSGPVYAPNSKGGPKADPLRTAEPLWHADGEMVRTAYTLRAEDDHWGQAGTLVRDVMDDAERGRLVSNVAGHLRDGVTEEVLQHTFEYWKTSTKKPATRSKPRYVTDRLAGWRDRPSSAAPTVSAPETIGHEGPCCRAPAARAGRSRRIGSLPDWLAVAET
jgi:hypothetical protein